MLADETGAIAQVLDVRDRLAVAALVAEIDFDIVVNNAGLGRAGGSLWTLDVDDIDRVIDTNLTSVLHILRAVLPGMIDRGKGHIVNMSSVLALYSGPAALYGATKGAMHKLSQDLRHELKGTGVRVSEINPGRVATEFYDVAYDDPERRASVTNTGCDVLRSGDVADAVVYVLDAPWRVNIGLLEIMPTEQTYGGAQFVPFEGRADTS